MINLDLTINGPVYSTDVRNSFESFTWINGITYTSSNHSAKDTLVSSTGCDSIVSLDLTIGTPDSAVHTVSACNSYKWIDGIWYNSSNNSATYTLTNSQGCDSLVTLDLTIYRDKASTDSVQLCGHSYTWINGVTYTNWENNATHTLQTMNGCDSEVTLRLRLHKVDTAVARSDTSISALATNATYQWLDCDSGYTVIPGATSQQFFPEKNGIYAVEVMQAGCVDTSACYAIKHIGLAPAGYFHNIVAFPKPTKGKVSVDFGSTYENIKVIVTNPLGQIVSSTKYRATSIIDLELGTSPGIYLIRFVTKEGVHYTIKVSKL